MRSNTKTIARNSFWIGLEVAIDMIVSFVMSVAIARGIGPGKLGYFVYITWLSGIATILGNLGIPLAICKYMAEYLGAGDRATARSIFELGLRLQALLASVITAGAILMVVFLGDPQFRLPSLILVCSIFPAMINSISTSANIAAETPAKNLAGALVSSITSAAIIALSLYRGWGLTGIAAGLLISRGMESVVRLIPTLAWVTRVSRVPLGPELRRRIFIFSAQGFALLLLGLIVWDRSEILFLKRICPDVRQLAFYSLAFGITEKVLTLIRVVSNSIGVTIRAQYGRDKTQLTSTISTALRYLLVISLPLYIALAVMSGPVIRLLYGRAYFPAIPVLAISALFGLPKVLLSLVQVFLQSAERQSFLVRWMLVAAVVNLLLDWVLITLYAACGAALANGLAQLFAIGGVWAYTARGFGLKLPLRSLFLLTPAAAAMALCLLVCRESLNPIPALLVGIPVGLLIYFLIMRAVGVLQLEDRERFGQFRSSIPARAVNVFDFALNFFFPVRGAKAQVR